MRNFILAANIFFIFPISAQAQWINKTDDDPFGNEKNSIAMTMAGGYGFGFSCKGKQEFQIVYLTTEETRDSANNLNLLSPILKIKIDESNVVDLSAEIDKAGDKLRLTTSDDKVLQVMKSMASAKQRIAVAIEFGGKRFHIQTFGTGGSRDAINKALKACKLDNLPAS